MRASETYPRRTGHCRVIVLLAWLYPRARILICRCTNLSTESLVQFKIAREAYSELGRITMMFMFSSSTNFAAVVVVVLALVFLCSQSTRHTDERYRANCDWAGEPRQYAGDRISEAPSSTTVSLSLAIWLFSFFIF
jgi:hypothetical protein